MNRTIIRMVFIFLVGLVISSCRINQSTITHSNELSFQKLFPFKMNENILVKVEPSSQETFRYGSNIQIVIENKSEQEIFFPVGFGIKMFVVRNNDWVEVQDKNSYYGEGSLLPPKSSGDYLNRISFYVRPVLAKQLATNEQYETIRIVIIGEIMSDVGQTGIPAGGYVDVIMEN